MIASVCRNGNARSVPRHGKGSDNLHQAGDFGVWLRYELFSRE
jgi:hypothetical protein